ncbi:MAG: toxin-activating lysine-acyltransferase [Rhodobacterales bacterium]|nr:MAG: toxin-activating lysine-acyltransferase [Rhodobacterales bacterium]
MTMGKTYRDRPIRDIEAIVSAPLLLGQIKIYSKGDQPVAYLSFASVTPDWKARIEAGERPEEVRDWRCGPEVVVVDVVSPFNEPEVFIQQFHASLATGSKRSN